MYDLIHSIRYFEILLSLSATSMAFHGAVLNAFRTYRVTRRYSCLSRSTPDVVAFAVSKTSPITWTVPLPLLNQNCFSKIPPPITTFQFNLAHHLIILSIGIAILFIKQMERKLLGSVMDLPASLCSSISLTVFHFFRKYPLIQTRIKQG